MVWDTGGWTAFKTTLDQRIAEFNAMVEQYKAGNGDLPNMGSKAFVFDFGSGTKLHVSMIERVVVRAPLLGTANRAPALSRGDGDSDNASLTEGDAGSSASGSLTLVDLDTRDEVTAAVTQVS
jgi:hypothetical protein